jgi:hypothetical protein
MKARRRTKISIDVAYDRTKLSDSLLNALSPKQIVTLNLRLRAKYPIRTRTFQFRVYEYYDPEVNTTAVQCSWM